MFLTIIKLVNSLALISSLYFALQGGGANLYAYWPRYGLLIASGIAIITGVYVFMKERGQWTKVFAAFSLASACCIFYFGYLHLGATNQYYEDLLYLWMKMKKGLEA